MREAEGCDVHRGDERVERGIWKRRLEVAFKWSTASHKHAYGTEDLQGITPILESVEQRMLALGPTRQMGASKC